MSCMIADNIVFKNLANAMAHFWQDLCYRIPEINPTGEKDPDRIGEIIASVANQMRRNNIISYNYRYDEHYDTSEHIDINAVGLGEYRADFRKNILQAYKDIAFLQYNSCEHPGYKNDFTWKVLAVLASIIADKFCSTDPLWKECNWGGK